MILTIIFSVVLYLLFLFIYNFVDKNLKFSLSKKYGNLKYLFVLLVVITYPISIFIAVGYGIYWFIKKENQMILFFISERIYIIS